MADDRRSRDDDPSALDRAEDAARELFDLREERARKGGVARELELRELLQQHRGAYSAFLAYFQRLPQSVARHGYLAVRGYARTHFLEEIYALGRASSRVARWRVEQELRSPVLINRLLSQTAGGELERQWFASYIAEHFSFPAFEALWRQIGGADQDPMAA